MLDIMKSGWGSVGAPLLPASLRIQWAQEPMPNWLCEELRAPFGATYARLDTTIWDQAKSASPRALIAIVNLLSARRREIEDLPIVDPSQRQEGVSLSNWPLSTRSRNALQSAGLIAKPDALQLMTFREVLRIKNLGMRCALEISCLLECALLARRSALEQLALPLKSGAQSDWKEYLLDCATRPWAASISELDSRFAPLLPSGADGTVAERIEQLLAEPDSLSTVLRGPDLVGALVRLEAALKKQADLKLDEALNDLLLSSSRRRKHQVEALTVRFGWGGKPPATLEESGQPLGITRERIRQIEKRFLDDLPDDLYLPQLDAAIDLLEKSVPLTLSNAQELLLQSGISRNRFPAESVISTAMLFKRKTDLRIHDANKKGSLLVGSHSSVRDIASTARRLAAMSGVASVYQVSATAKHDASAPEEVRRILNGLANVEFLNEDWFWVTDLPIRRNRLSNVAKRILSVASPQSIQSIRDGVRRHFTFRSKSHSRFENLVTPPSDVLASFFKHSPEFKLIDSSVAPASPLNYQQELGDSERTLVEVFRSTATGVLDRRSVIEACTARGMNENTTSILLTYGPSIEHVGVDIWKLRGVQVDPSAVEALRSANALEPREKRVLSYGWRPSGKLWIATRVPYTQANVVVGVPGTMRRYLDERTFLAVDVASGERCGQISVNGEGTSFGYGAFLRVSGAEHGDVMLAEFDVATDKVELSLADESVLYADELESTL